MARSLSERLPAKAIPEPNTGCWLWTGAADAKGYGRIGVDGSRPALAHRVSFEMHKGAIPPGLTIDHKCRVKGCVNPDHLDAVTQHENNRRAGVYEAAAKKRLSQTHCRHGHPYAGQRLVPNKSGARVCRECHRLSGRKAAAKRRAFATAVNF